ncbi:hypothetical protein VIGAN_11077700 [Vigna angularis var. angularis]|uniref:Berberine/berberine-like domain-containing protein n=1 Tax=Vigna angularis var. angularis TaxID=157739 RepID=A0A0S3T983_PHAAN|nr:hypothetical protein VIGAN_11077700 [Vigna angularis var. angularis]
MAKHMNWMRKFYIHTTPYVSKSPRETYVNYRDLDIGMNQKNNTSFVKAWSWGYRYFKGNFNSYIGGSESTSYGCQRTMYFSGGGDITC